MIDILATCLRLRGEALPSRGGSLRGSASATLQSNSPYRESLLTNYMRDALTRSGPLVVLHTISSADICLSDTYHTLRWLPSVWPIGRSHRRRDSIERAQAAAAAARLAAATQPVTKRVMKRFVTPWHVSPLVTWSSG
jgi:hypothetical protein